jgi:HKD family nuclease
MIKTLCGNPGDKAAVVGLPADFDLDKQLRSARMISLATAFATMKGWNIIADAILKSNAEIHIVTGLYCCHTEPKLLWEWLGLVPQRPNFYVSLAVSPRAKQKGTLVFHPKVFIVSGETAQFAIVGSGNLTSGGFRSNVECSIYTAEVGHVDALVQWFRELECTPLSEKAILKYEPHYDKAASARKALEAAQKVAEDDIRLEIVFRRRSEAIQAAKAYFGSVPFAEKKARLSNIIPTYRKMLAYPAFTFDTTAWTEFYKKSWLGKIREAYLPSTVENIGKIQDGLRFLFGETHGIEERLPQLMEANGKFHVHGVGRNLVSKWLAIHDPQMWFVFNKQVATTLADFGYEYIGAGNTTDSYLAFVEAMRGFRGECGAEDCVALDSFFSYWYGKIKASQVA